MILAAPMGGGSVQVFILTHNRPKMVMQSLASVLKQNYPNLQVILSDNSTNSITEEETKGISDSRFTYKKRIPPLSAEKHFQTVISEVSADYYLIFHDDDLLLDGAISKFVEAMEEFPTAVAIGANAFFLFGGKKTTKLAVAFSKQGVFKPSRKVFLKKYFRAKGVIPFPSYFYRRSRTEGHFLDFRKGGKYSDVSFLLDLFQKGDILWLTEPLMCSRIHQGQDTLFPNFSHAKSLLKYVDTQAIFSKISFPITFFKKVHFYLFWKQGLANGTSQKHPKLFFRIIFNWLFADYSGSSQEHQARRGFHGKDLRVVFASECLADFQVFSPSANF